MVNITKEKLAELIIYSDNIHDILSEYDFNQDLKMEFSRVDKATKKIIKFAFNGSSVGELDEWKFKIRTFVNELIGDNVKLKGE